MKIHSYVVAYNEEKILPFYLDHYSKFCSRIFVLDNMSTDSTRSIAESCPIATVLPWGSENIFGEELLMNLRSNVYREHGRGVADWVMVTDADEFIYHPDIVSLLSKYKQDGVTVPLIDGYEMVGDSFPDPHLPIIDQIKTGVQRGWISKRIVFDPVLDMEFGAGSHPDLAPLPQGSVDSQEAEIKMLHYKWICADYVTERYKSFGERERSNTTKEMGWGVHYLNSPESVQDEYQYWLEQRCDVL